jgi:uncharacterized alkaline shock family protein YloU
MLTKENYLGKITVTDNYIKSLVYRTVAGCFGVAGMKSCTFGEFVFGELLGIKKDGIGVRIIAKNNELIVNLHISVTYGTNVAAVVNSVKNKVEFALAEYVGVPVRSVNVYVDSIKE